MYRPPDSSLYTNKSFENNFETLLKSVNGINLETLLLGDLNINYLKKNDHQNLKGIIKLNGFEQIVNQPTRTTKDTSTLIDIILTNRPSNIVRHDVFSLSLSDHDCVGCVRKLNHERLLPRTITCRNYKSYDSHRLCEELNNTDWSSGYSSTCVNSAWSLMKNILQSSFNTYAPKIVKRVKGWHCPWLSNDIKNHMNERDKLLRKARKSKRSSDWKRYKQKKNYCTNTIRNAKNNFQKNLINENRHDSTKFWDILKRVFPSKSGKSRDSSAPFIDGSDDSSQSKANAFCNFFSTVALS